MFNSIKMHLVPHFPIILLYSLKISLLNIYHAKCHAQTHRVYFLNVNNTVNGCHNKRKRFPGTLMFLIQQNALSSSRHNNGQLGMLFSVKDVKGL